MTIINFAKKLLWILILPFFPIGRDLAKKLGYHPYPPRQNFHLGYLKVGVNKEELEEYLKQSKFKINKVAWVDDEEILSVRRMDGFEHQYHIRLFADNEIRGHYELSPEYSPLGHLHDVGTIPTTEDFKKFLGDYLVEEA
ncbi:MAG TPA: hypothetical protein DEB09_05255 [Candidatus Magasanikbacteria bacterium]|nr:hypothetical protein [Candidatus Magasanikbacteria bacterium]